MKQPQYKTFEEARKSDATIASAIARGASLETLALVLVNERNSMLEYLLQTELLCPRKIRGPNGEVWIYRAPDHLIPEPPKEPLFKL